MTKSTLAGLAASLGRDPVHVPPPAISLAMGDIAMALGALGRFPALAAPQTGALDLLAVRAEALSQHLYGEIAVCHIRPGQQEVIAAAELVVIHLLHLRGYRPRDIPRDAGIVHNRGVFRQHPRHAEIAIVSETRDLLAEAGWRDGDTPPAAVTARLADRYRPGPG